MIRSQAQRGFTVIETLLVLIVLGGIGFTGWYVWQSKIASDEALNKTGNGNAAKIEKDKASAADETSAWLLYQTPGKEFSLRLADGWNFTRPEKSPYLAAYGTENASYKKGTTAKVTEVVGGKDGTAVGLFIAYRENGDAGVPRGIKEPNFQTAGGLQVSKYSYVETEVNEGLGGLPKGGKQYTYYVQSKDRALMEISYGIAASDIDQHDIVEKAVTTVVFN